MEKRDCYFYFETFIRKHIQECGFKRNLEMILI